MSSGGKGGGGGGGGGGGEGEVCQNTASFPPPPPSHICLGELAKSPPLIWYAPYKLYIQEYDTFLMSDKTPIPSQSAKKTYLHKRVFQEFQWANFQDM